MSASTPPSGKPAKHLSGRLAQWPFQIIAPAGRASDPQRPLRDRFPELLPRKPYATDHLELGLSIMPRPQALRRRHIQLNGPSAFVWMTHDIDQREAWLVHDDAYVPQPNVIVLNPANGHAHASYLLAVPVARHAASREAPLRYFAAVERGIARRIGADRRYCGLIAKNPLHPDWRVEWRRNEPYTLEELADWLFPRDMAPDTSIEVTLGAGRNCSIFDTLRATAYREVRDYKRLGDLEAFRDRLDRLAVDINNAFSVPIGPCEVRAIVRSVSRWSWKHFSDAGFSRRQSVLGRRGAAARWAGHISAEQTKPWIADGISRRTWYRRRRLQS
jgi:Replicase family/Primase C terminal 1 (PriCT-1)